MNPTRTPIRSLALLGIALLALAGCASVAPREPVTLRLIALNDFHGNLESTGLVLGWPDPAQPGRAARLATGGAAAIAGTVTALRASASNSLVVSSGDMIGGTPLISALFRHESTIDIANRIGVDIAAPGNHEFDAGTAEYLRVLGGGCAANDPKSNTVSCALEPYRGARFVTVAANVERVAGGTLFPPATVREIGGIKVGFIGAVTESTPTIVVPSGVAGLRFTEEAGAINRAAAELQRQGVQAIVVLIHEGGNTGEPGQPLDWNNNDCPNARGPIFDIVRRLSPAVDVVFSAHSHQGYNCLLGGRPVMQATALGRGLSVVDLVLDPKTGDVDRSRTLHRNLPVLNASTEPALRAAVLAAEPAPWRAVLERAVPDAAVAERVAAYARAAAPIASREVARIVGGFDRTGRSDSSAARLIADAQWMATRAPDRGGSMLALMNPGGVRSDLACRGTPPCPVTYGDVFTVQPFGNSLVVMTLTGAEFRNLLESQQPPGRERPTLLIPSASLSYRWVASAPFGQRVQDLRLAGQPVAPDQRVRLTVNSFMADGGDGFGVLRNGRERLGGELDLDALVTWLQSGPAPIATPRITLGE